VQGALTVLSARMVCVCPGRCLGKDVVDGSREIFRLAQLALAPTASYCTSLQAKQRLLFPWLMKADRRLQRASLSLNYSAVTLYLGLQSSRTSTWQLRVARKSSTCLYRRVVSYTHTCPSHLAYHLLRLETSPGRSPTYGSSSCPSVASGSSSHVEPARPPRQPAKRYQFPVTRDGHRRKAPTLTRQ
jgi:hypothetical protein